MFESIILKISSLIKKDQLVKVNYFFKKYFYIKKGYNKNTLFKYKIM